MLDKNKEQTAMTTICTMPDHIFLDTEYKQPAIHQHLAKHIIISLSDDLTVTFEGERKAVCKGVMIDANVPHTVAGRENRMLVFLIDATSTVARNMNHDPLAGEPFKVIDGRIVEQIREAYKACLPDRFESEYAEFSEFVFCRLSLNGKSTIIPDPRVQTALGFISQSADIDGAMISRLCENAHLSQSRFSHLFKEQTGVSLNSYLMLAKLRKAYQLMLEGETITAAAMNAGFGTPSHFSAASRKYLGIAASDIKGRCNVYDIKCQRLFES